VVDISAAAGLALQAPDWEAVEIAAAVALCLAQPTQRAAAVVATEIQVLFALERLAAPLVPIARAATLVQPPAALLPFRVLAGHRIVARTQPEERRGAAAHRQSKSSTRPGIEL
jgi:hypothetical protein